MATAELPLELQIWNGMPPMQRYAVMERVPYTKSIVKRHRACLALIKQELAA